MATLVMAQKWTIVMVCPVQCYYKTSLFQMKDLLAIKMLMGRLSEMNLENYVNFALMVIIVTKICKGEL